MDYFIEYRRENREKLIILIDALITCSIEILLTRKEKKDNKQEKETVNGKILE